jgi:hypothetical protein
VISRANNDAPEEPDDDALDKDTADKHTDDNSYHSSDKGNVSASDFSVGSDDDPSEDFDDRELGAFGDLECINCHDKTETWTPILSLNESGIYAITF